MANNKILLCSLCLCGDLCLVTLNHRDTEDTEAAQRNQLRYLRGVFAETTSVYPDIPPLLNERIL
jgi:hypothetical protein